MQLLRTIFDKLTNRPREFDPLISFYTLATKEQIETHDAIVQAICDLSAPTTGDHRAVTTAASAERDEAEIDNAVPAAGKPVRRNFP